MYSVKLGLLAYLVPIAKLNVLKTCVLIAPLCMLVTQGQIKRLIGKRYWPSNVLLQKNITPGLGNVDHKIGSSEEG